MPDPVSISDAEWEVMNVLWSSHAPMMATEIIDRLTGTAWSPRTIKTMLNRLTRKRALAFEVQGKSYLYRPAFPREHAVRAASRSFLSRVFKGAVGPMVLQFVQEAELSPQEMASLQRLLEQKQRARQTRKR